MRLAGPSDRRISAPPDNTLLPKLKSLPGSGRMTTLIRMAFDDANNYMKNGTLMRQVINKINGIDFNVADDRHLFGDIDAKLLKDLQVKTCRVRCKHPRRGDLPFVHTFSQTG